MKRVFLLLFIGNIRGNSGQVNEQLNVTNQFLEEIRYLKLIILNLIQFKLHLALALLEMKCKFQ
jgi:hypothetical protein